MLDGKVIIIHLITALIKKISLDKMSSYSESNSHIRNEKKSELNLSNYAAKSDTEKQQAIIH